MNNNALKKACPNKWNNAKLYADKPIAIVIIPNWLIVDKAIILFKSLEHIAIKPALNVVKAPIHKIINKTVGVYSKILADLNNK